jgi:hypothetical protein
MPGLLGRVDDVALVGYENRQGPDLVLHLAEQNKPKLGGLLVEMPLVGIGDRSLLLGISQDNVGHRAVVGNEAAVFIRAIHDSVEIDVRPVALIVLAAAIDPYLFEFDAIHRDRRLIGGIHELRAGYVDFQAQRRLIAHRFQAVGGAIGHLHKKALGSDERLLSFDGEADLAILHDPPFTRIGTEAARGLSARGHGDVIGVEQRIAHHGLRPIGLSLVLREQVGEFPERPVRGHPGGRLGGNRRPGQTAILLGPERQKQGECQECGLHDCLRYHQPKLV